MFEYLEEGTLPADEKRAKVMVLSKSQFVITNGVLHHLKKDKSLNLDRSSTGCSEEALSRGT